MSWTQERSLGKKGESEVGVEINGRETAMLCLLWATLPSIGLPDLFPRGTA
jgi:hypothetical protein